MLAIKKARKVILADPGSEAARTLADLVLALEHEGAVDVKTLYQLEFDLFELALEILREWRLDRYYASKLKLYDAILLVQAVELPRTHTPEPA